MGAEGVSDFEAKLREVLGPKSDAERRARFLGLIRENVKLREEARRNRVFVNETGTLLVRLWSSGVVEVAMRPDPSDVWGPVVTLKETL